MDSEKHFLLLAMQGHFPRATMAEKWAASAVNCIAWGSMHWDNEAVQGLLSFVLRAHADPEACKAMQEEWEAAGREARAVLEAETR